MKDRNSQQQGEMSLIERSSNLNTLTCEGQARCLSTKLRSDLMVEVDDVLFHLHEFPLLSKSGRLNKLVFEARDTEKDRIKLADLPEGAKSFELAAKFCYGSIPVEITPSNVVALRCAAEYLEMTEDLEQGNLISKTEEFLSYIILVSWLDCITVLQSCTHLSPWVEDLNIVQRCIESIAWKATTDPAQIKWPFTPRENNSCFMSPKPNYQISLSPPAGRAEVYDLGSEGEDSKACRNVDLEVRKLKGEFADLRSYCEGIQLRLEKASKQRRVLDLLNFTWKCTKEKRSALITSENGTNGRGDSGRGNMSTRYVEEGRICNIVKRRRNSI